MPATLEQPASESATPRSVFILRFVSTVVLWSIALLIAFSGYEVFFWLLISAFGLIALLEFYRMLDHAHLPNFKIIGLICGAIMLAGSFHYFSTSASGMRSSLTGRAIGRHLIVPHVSTAKTCE